MKLHAWDVPAALLGVIIASVLVVRFPSWRESGAAVMSTYAGPIIGLVSARRAMFPLLTPPEGLQKAPPSLGRRLAAYALLIFGGFLVFLPALLLYAAAVDEKNPGFAWPALIPLAIGGAMGTVGVRWLT